MYRRFAPYRTNHVYHVTDSAGAVVYVGVTFHPRTRMTQHRSQARLFRGRGSPFMTWLRAEMQAGRSPQLVVVRRCGSDPLGDEQREIRRMVRAGQPLLNVA